MDRQSLVVSGFFDARTNSSRRSLASSASSREPVHNDTLASSFTFQAALSSRSGRSGAKTLFSRARTPLRHATPKSTHTHKHHGPKKAATNKPQLTPSTSAPANIWPLSMIANEPTPATTTHQTVRILRPLLFRTIYWPDSASSVSTHPCAQELDPSTLVEGSRQSQRLES